jgi:hypothetical protein
LTETSVAFSSVFLISVSMFASTVASLPPIYFRSQRDAATAAAQSV